MTIKTLALAFTVCMAQHALAQETLISPPPQNITWGGNAFPNTQKFYLKGAEQASIDAVDLLLDQLDICDCHQAKPLVIGELDDKVMKAYRKFIPQHREGYYLKITPESIVVAGHDEAGTYHGVQALLTIMSQPEVMQCTITAWPQESDTTKDK